MEGVALTFFDWATGSLFFLMVPIFAAIGGVMVWFLGERRYVWLPALLLWSVVGAYIYCHVAQDDVHAWIAREGQTGALVLNGQRATGNMINDEPEMEWIGTLRLADGSLKPVTIATHTVRMHPVVSPYSPPTGQVIPVRYPAARPDMIVVTLANAAEQQKCADVMRAIPEIDAQILLLSGDAKAAAQAKRNALTQEFFRCHAPK